jgi:hypothetical protein
MKPIHIVFSHAFSASSSFDSCTHGHLTAPRSEKGDQMKKSCYSVHRSMRATIAIQYFSTPNMWGRTQHRAITDVTAKRQGEPPSPSPSPTKYSNDEKNVSHSTPPKSRYRPTSMVPSFTENPMPRYLSQFWLAFLTIFAARVSLVSDARDSRPILVRK